MTILDAVQKLRPGTAWTLRGDVLEQADDGTPRVDVPSMDEIQPLIDVVAYREKRAVEYPPLPDQLDALWKGGQAQADMLAKIKSVKERFPKP